MKFKSLIKILVSAVMLIVVLRMAKYDQLVTTFKSIPLPTLLLVVVGYTCGQLLSSYKWCLIANSSGIEASYPAALRAYFMGMYINCFGLGTIGGDVARGLLLAEGQQKAEALTSVIADRLHGLAVLSAIGALAAASFGTLDLDPWLVAALVSIGAGIAIGWIVAPPLVLRFFPRQSRFRIRIERMVAAFPRRPRILIQVTCISIIFHLLQISLHRVMGLAVGVEIPWSVLFVAIPFVNIMATLPISWNGLGVRERGYVFFLVPAVLKPEHAVAFGAMWLVAVTVTSAIGGIVAVMTKDFSRLEEVQAHEDTTSTAQSS